VITTLPGWSGWRYACIFFYPGELNGLQAGLEQMIDDHQWTVAEDGGHVFIRRGTSTVRATVSVALDLWLTSRAPGGSAPPAVALFSLVAPPLPSHNRVYIAFSESDREPPPWPTWSVIGPPPAWVPRPRRARPTGAPVSLSRRGVAGVARRRRRMSGRRTRTTRSGVARGREREPPDHAGPVPNDSAPRRQRRISREPGVLYHPAFVPVLVTGAKHRA
jgi:hypothetical protein